MDTASVRWYVIRAKARRERYVEDQLSQQGLEVFYPCVTVKPVNPRAARERAYFPGYLFIHAQLAQLDLNRLRWLPATNGLLEFGGDPAIVPDIIIQQLRRRVAAIQSAGGLTLADLKHGEPVEITSGVLAGYKAIFDLRLKGSQRVRVLLELLQRQVSVEVHADQVRKLAGNNKPTPETRARR